MKQFSKRMLKVALTLCMIAGQFTTLAFAQTTDEETPKNYVSLGDSMTNGYGHEGYNANTGTEDYGEPSYANQFAGFINAKDHAQLAMSAMRAEDLHWLLEVDYNDPAVKNVINKMENNRVWDEDLWYSVFSTGDFYTWEELVNDYRFDIAAAYIEDFEGIQSSGEAMTDNQKNNIEKYYTDLGALKIVAEYYQTKVRDAHVISLGIGNGNFGVFMFGRIMEAIGFDGKTPEDAMIYDIDRAIQECDPTLQTYLRTLKAKAEDILASKGFVADDGNPGTTTQEALYNTFLYATISYALNYAGTVEAILQLNPDAEIILVALMNTLKSNSSSENQITLGNVMDALIVPLNAYIAALPTVMQASNNSVYKNATFYYAEADFVECIVDTYDPNEALNETVRDRFYHSIVLEEDGITKGMVWKLLGNKVTNITLKQIKDFESQDDSGKITQIINGQMNPNIAMSIQMYLAFENAIKKGKESSLTIDSLMGITDLFADDANPFAQIMTDYESRVKELVVKGDSRWESLTMLPEAQRSQIFSLLVMPEELSEIIVNSELNGLLALFARCVIGNGIGSHPSEAGHEALFKAVKEAYEKGHTAKDETIENIKDTLEVLGELIKEYGPEVADQIWAQWEEYGYVEAVETTIDELETLVNERYAYYTERALPAINDSIQAMLTQKDALTVELDALKVELAAKKAELAEVIAKQEIGSIYVPEINIDAELGGNEQTVVPGHDCVVTEETIEAELNAAIADLEHAIAVIEALLSDIEADLADMIVLAEQIADAVAELEKTAQSIVEAGKDLSNAIEDIAEVLKNSDGVVEAVKSSLDAAYTTAQAAADVLNLTVNTANELVADINSMITIIAEDAEALYNKFIEDLPGCIDQIPEEARLIIGGSIMMVEKALEENKEEIKAVLAEELKKLAEQYDVDVNEVQNAIDELTALYNADEEEIKAKLTALAAEYGITEESIRAELDKVKAQISEEVNAKYSVIEAEMNAKIEELKTEANNKLDALNAELEGLYTELNNAIEEDKAVIQAQIDRVLGDIQVVSEDLECAVSHLEEAAQIAYEEIVAEVTEVYETVIAELNAKLEELKEAYDKAVEELNNELAALKEVFEQKVEELKAKLEELKKAYDKAVEDLTAAADKAIEELIAEANKQLEALGKLGEALNEALNGIYDAIREELTNTQLAIEAILKGQLEAVKDLAEALGEIALDSINEIIDTLIEQINALLEKVTTDDLVLVNHDDYVALGDSSAVSESYVDSFADEIEKEYGITLDVTNLAGDTQTLENAVEVITSNAQTIAEAELITLGYGNNAFADAALNNMYDTLRTGSSNSCDWAGLVGAEAVPYIEEALNAIKADLVEAGLDVKVPFAAMDKATLATALMVAIETYAYETVAYTVSLPSVIAAIRELNSEAVVIVVGMYNPFRGTTLTYDNVSIELGDYVDVLVEAANLYATGLCMMTQDAIFVEASDADTDLSNQTIDVSEFIITYFYEKTLDLNPNETGHAYITAQLLEALNIKLDYLLGDVNLDGKVQAVDAALAYRMANGLFDASKLQKIVGDVTGDEKNQAIDASMIYRYANGLQDSFPAENK